MVFQNTYRGFFYRQIFITPALITRSTVSLKGKTAIVTGSNTGLGYHASSQLLALGLSRLILAVRDTKKGEAAKKSLLETLRQSGTSDDSEPNIEIWPIDLTEYSSITAFADRMRTTPNIEVNFCILNAGVVCFDYEHVPNGNELTIQTNWLGTAALALLLRPILQAQYERHSSTANGHAANDNATSHSPPILSIVGSDSAQLAVAKELEIARKEHTSVVNVLNDKRNFSLRDRYYTSKLLLTLFFRKFIDRLPSSNIVVINLVNPGFCYGSELHRNLSGVLSKVFGAMKRAIGRSTEVGARTLTHAVAVAGKESHGLYLSDQKVAPWMDFVASDKGKQAAGVVWEDMSREFEGKVNVKDALKDEYL
ncbi:MAG: hypothetical protein Q9191_001653 [Dirinaria sp. TL-2023a]